MNNIDIVALCTLLAVLAIALFLWAISRPSGKARHYQWADTQTLRAGKERHNEYEWMNQ